jgi:hypothetical protein
VDKHQALGTFKTMATPSAQAWDRARQAFSDQFEQDGSSFIYRRSQKGEAIRVSDEERSKFINEHDRNLRRAKWIIYVGLILATTCAIAFSLLTSSDLSEGAIAASVVIVMVPYIAYYRWAWGAPSRELEGRTPIAGERPSDEIRRLRLQRITYRQLATAAGVGLAVPFFESTRQDIFSGWNRIWLILGAAIILLAAVQAFRKWRFDQDDSLRSAAWGPSSEDISSRTDGSIGGLTGSQLWRYVPTGVIFLGIGFIAFIPAGKRTAQEPNFWSFVMLGAGAWALVTVLQGFAKGQIEPFMRGIYNSYQRETQPKRFWMSVAWNGFFGCLCLWLAFQTATSAN